jgi:uncharacterized protein YcgI (DUF1989 family)
MSINRAERGLSEAYNPSCQFDAVFYDKIRATQIGRQPVEAFIIPPYNGRAFIVNRGQAFRIIEAEGPQVGDVTVWNTHNPKEHFRPGRTFLLEGWMLRRNTQLWSDVPWFRPLATCLEDTVVNTSPPSAGFNNHIVTGAHCTPEMYERNAGRVGVNACHLNFLQAIEPFGLKEDDIDDNFLVFQKMRVDPKDGRKYSVPCDGKKGDYIEFYAELDLLVAVSVCPVGAGGIRGVMPEDVVVRPLGIEIYETGVEPKEFPKWTDWRPAWKGKWVPSHP